MGEWKPVKGERVAIDGHRWWTRKTQSKFDDLGYFPTPPLSGLGTVLRRLPAGDIADYEVVVDGDGDPIWRTFCYHLDELTRA